MRVRERALVRGLTPYVGVLRGVNMLLSHARAWLQQSTGEYTCLINGHWAKGLIQNL